MAVGLQPGSGPPALSCHRWAREGQAGLGPRPELRAPRGRGRALTPGAHPRSPASSVSVGQTCLTLTRRPAQPGQDTAERAPPRRCWRRGLRGDPGLAVARHLGPVRGPGGGASPPGAPAEGTTPPQPEAAGASRAHVCRLSLRLRLFAIPLLFAHASPACPSFRLLLRKNTAQRRFF